MVQLQQQNMQSQLLQSCDHLPKAARIHATSYFADRVRMEDRFNTIAGWVLFSGIIALGLSSIFMRVFDTHRPEAMGYPVEVADAGGGADAGPDLGTLLAAASVENGAQQAAARCGTCHSFEQGGAQGQGPNLYATLGDTFAHVAGFGYSDALASKDGSWTWEAMNAWLLNPRQFVPGTSMGFAGLKNDEQRADILVYLNSLGSNLPLPEPKVAEEEPAAEGEAEEAGEEAEADAAAEAEATEDAAAEENEGGA